MRGKHWLIRGYDGAALQKRWSISFGMMSEKQIIVLLERLACKHLSPDEIMSASMRKGSPGYSALLEARKETTRGRRIIGVGESLHYVAELLDGKDSD